MPARKRVHRGVIEAAGGIVWRDGPAGREVAAIYRARYDDWSLPKGWVEKGETWAAAAVREVQEETGCQVELGDFAGCSAYVVNGVPKVVLFWHMRLVGECAYAPNDETDALAWLSPAEAGRRLSYASERKLVALVIEPG